MTHLVKIGNSQGIRIPEPLIKQARLEGREFQLQIVNEGLLISSCKKPRDGWKESIEATLSNHSAEIPDNEWLDATLTADEELEW
jgi:antitoxin MazE